MRQAGERERERGKKKKKKKNSWHVQSSIPPFPISLRTPVISTRNALFGSFITCAVPKSWRAVLICAFSAPRRVKQPRAQHWKMLTFMSKNAFHGGHLLLSDQYGTVWVMKDAVISGQHAFHLFAGDVTFYFLLEILSTRMWVFLIFLSSPPSHFQCEDIPKTLLSCLRVYRKIRISRLVPFV